MKRWALLLLSAMVLADSVPVSAMQAEAPKQREEQSVVTPDRTVTPEEVVTPEEITPKEIAPEEVVTPEETGYPVEPTGGEEPSWKEYELYLEEYPGQELAPGETYILSVWTDAPKEELVYESSKPDVATVSAAGIITAVSGGVSGSATAEITVRWTNPDNEYDTVSASCFITVTNEIHLNKSTYTIYTGQKTQYRLTATTNPVGTVTWSSSNPAVAAVDATGKLTAIKAGTTTVTATANGVSAQCQVTVKKPSLSLKRKTTVYVKNPVSLEAKVSPSTKISWKSSNTKIATVNSQGIVTGKKTGTVTITAKAHGITKTCRVTVKKPSISIVSADYHVFSGSSIQAYANATPATTITWKSSNTKVAKVDENGNITGVRAGTAVITAGIPGAKAECKVTVHKNSYQLSFTKRTLMKGNSATLYVKNLSGVAYPSFYVDDYPSSVSLTTDDGRCVIKGTEKGTSVIHVSFQVYQDGSFVSWNRPCTVKVLDAGISTQQFSVAKGKTKKLKVLNPPYKENIRSITWTSSAPKVAAVDSATGTVTAKKAGSASITATVSYLDGSTKRYKTAIKVSDPKFAASSAVVAMYGSKQLTLKGTNSYSEIKWKSKKQSVVAVSADGTLMPKKTGKAVITAVVDGKSISCTVYVSNPMLQSSYSALAPGRSTSISLSGLAAKSRVTYSSSNPGVAVVDNSGTITAVSGGRSEITVNADGREFSYLVEVASQAALDARAEGKSIMDRSSYSQAYRMTEGYYDCSSLVFRAYGRNSGLLGGSYSWAPTAAGMAQHMANTGKVISWGPVNVEDLRPGDLIFYGQENNGRYLGIYHVSMYYGNGSRLEIGMYGYYPRSNIVMVARPMP